jgi:hypothetical protein
MKNLRPILSLVVLVLLVGGYGASQSAVFSGTTEAYAKKVDCPQTQWIALGVLLLSIACAFIREPGADEK